MVVKGTILYLFATQKSRRMCLFLVQMTHKMEWTLIVFKGRDRILLVMVSIFLACLKLPTIVSIGVVGAL